MDEPSPPKSVLLSIAYDGRPFHGYAEQPGQATVAGALASALRAIDPTIGRLRGTSRTDAGVHARDQRVAFDPAKDLPMSAWTHGAQRHLPASISILSARPVAPGYFPRAHVVSKTYRYAIATAEARDPFLHGLAFRVPGLDDASFARMEEEARAFVGTHDFSAFCGASDEREDKTRTVFSTSVERAVGGWMGLSTGGTPLLGVTVTGSGFLYHMVRIFVGTLLDVGRGRLAPGAIARALHSKNRRDAGITAPPDGLCLERTELGDLESP